MKYCRLTWGWVANLWRKRSIFVSAGSTIPAFLPWPCISDSNMIRDWTKKKIQVILKWRKQIIRKYLPTFWNKFPKIKINNIILSKISILWNKTILHSPKIFPTKKKFRISFNPIKHKNNKMVCHSQLSTLFWEGLWITLKSLKNRRK